MTAPTKPTSRLDSKLWERKDDPGPEGPENKNAEQLMKKATAQAGTNATAITIKPVSASQFDRVRVAPAPSGPSSAAAGDL